MTLNAQLFTQQGGNATTDFDGVSDAIIGEKQHDHFVIHVREPMQAVTSSTTYSAFGGPKQPVGNLDNIVLVADTELEKVGTIAIINVNKNSGDVIGIVHKEGQDVQISQSQGQESMVRTYSGRIMFDHSYCTIIDPHAFSHWHTSRH